MAYPNIFVYVDPTKASPPKSKPVLPGMYPTEENRRKILEELKSAVISKAITFHCERLCREMGTFSWIKFHNRLKAQAEKSQHDDHVMAAAGCWFMTKFVRHRLKRKRQVEEDTELVIGRYGQVIARVKRGRGAIKPWLI